LILDILKQFPAILIAISVHEYGHALVAYAMGDDTAKRANRMTLDPLKHIDMVGMIVLLLAHFGWAKPVPIDERNFRNKRLGLFAVSLAGPAFNLICALVFLILYKLEAAFVGMYALDVMLAYVFKFNILFAAFNMLPIPPLDGSKMLLSVLPGSVSRFYWQYESYGTVILIALIFTNKIGLFIYPIVDVFERMLLSIA